MRKRVAPSPEAPPPPDNPVRNLEREREEDDHLGDLLQRLSDVASAQLESQAMIIRSLQEQANASSSSSAARAAADEETLRRLAALQEEHLRALSDATANLTSAPQHRPAPPLVILDDSNESWNKLLRDVVGVALEPSVAAKLKEEFKDYEAKFHKNLRAKDLLKSMKEEETLLLAGRVPSRMRAFKMPFVCETWDQVAPDSLTEVPASITFSRNMTFRQMKEALYKGYQLANKRLDIHVQSIRVGESDVAVGFREFLNRCQNVDAPTRSEIDNLGIPELAEIFPRRSEVTTKMAATFCRTIAKKVAADRIKEKKKKDAQQKADVRLRDSAALLDPAERWKKAIVQVVNDNKTSKLKPEKPPTGSNLEVDYVAMQGATIRSGADVPTRTRVFTKKQLAERKNGPRPGAGRAETTARNPRPTAPKAKAKAKASAAPPARAQAPRTSSSSAPTSGARQSGGGKGKGRGQNPTGGRGGKNNGRGSGGKAGGKKGGGRGPNA